MTRTILLLAGALPLLAACATQPVDTGPSLQAVVDGAHRTPEFRARDVHRHPAETLAFFGLRPDLSVVEVWPGAGWYTEILAPYVRERGHYYAAGFVLPGEAAYRRNVDAKFRARLAARPDLYERVTITALGGPDRWTAAPAGSADLVLTFRNVHNWMTADEEDEMFQAFFAALKPGGVLGVVEHRAAPGTPVEAMEKSGYVTEDYVIEVATRAGFALDARSEINANPRDTKDHPEGVWTLPPTLRLGDKDRDKYVAIGESDRMTLRFVKPR